MIVIYYHTLDKPWINRLILLSVSTEFHSALCTNNFQLNLYIPGLHKVQCLKQPLLAAIFNLQSVSVFINTYLIKPGSKDVKYSLSSCTTPFLSYFLSLPSVSGQTFHFTIHNSTDSLCFTNLLNGLFALPTWIMPTFISWIWANILIN